MATHSSVLAWRIPGTGEPGGLPSVGSHRVGHDWSDLAGAAALCLIFISLTNMCLWVFCLGSILFGTLWVSWTWVAISFPILGKFSTIISSSIFSWPFFLSSSRARMIRVLGRLTLSQRSLRLSSFLLIHFLFSSLFHLFLPFCPLPHLSYLLPLLFSCWFPPECFLSHLLHY